MRAVKKLQKTNNALLITEGILYKNPVLTLGLGVPLVISASVSLKSGVIISLLLFFSNLAAFFVSELLALYVKSSAIRIPICVLVTAVSVFVLSNFMIEDQQLVSDLGIYIPIITVNTLMLEQAGKKYLQNTFFIKFISVLRSNIGFVAVMLLVSAVREVVGSNTIYGIALHNIPIEMSGILLPFFGFIITGLLGALLQITIRFIKANSLKHSPLIKGGRS